MDLSHFFAATFSSQCIDFTIVSDNAHTHHLEHQAPIASTTRKTLQAKKLCRWDSSLSPQEARSLHLDSPKRTSDTGCQSRVDSDDESSSSDNNSIHQNERIKFPAPQQEKEQPDSRRRGSSSSTMSTSTSSCRFDMQWASPQFMSSSSQRSRQAASDPPRMPHRQTEYFPEADDRDVRPLVLLSSC